MPYYREFVECFPVEDIGVLYECVNEQCFFGQHMFSLDECVWKDRWNGHELLPEPFCPSCEKPLVRYVENAIQT